MKIVSLTDLHGKLPDFTKILNDAGSVDLILLTGDITHFGGAKQAQIIVDSVTDLSIPVLAVTGNCDLPGVGQFLDDINIHIHGIKRKVNDVTILGVGGSLPCPGKTPNEMDEDQFEAHLNQAAQGIEKKDTLLLVSHQPPANTMNDALVNGMHVGSKAVRKFIENWQPLVCFTGHIHEGKGIDFIGRTKIINPGPASQGGYGFIEIFDGEALAEIREIQV